VQGSFTTVVGLPLEPLSDLLAQCGLSWKIGA
jgi:predicted house-cleaning NTP pyrophosphatase (Maf/HAM1 superfamily)